jgi:hypothetical protein
LQENSLFSGCSLSGQLLAAIQTCGSRFAAVRA